MSGITIQISNEVAQSYHELIRHIADVVVETVNNIANRVLDIEERKLDMDEEDDLERAEEDPSDTIAGTD